LVLTDFQQGVGFSGKKSEKLGAFRYVVVLLDTSMRRQTLRKQMVVVMSR
jgi:hypothetical protein